MCVRWICCVWVWCTPLVMKAQGGRSLVAGEVFGKQRTALGVAEHPSASIWLKAASGAVTAEDQYGTGITNYHMAFALPGRSNGWVVHASRSGTSVLHQSLAGLAWCKALSPDLGLSIRLGYGSMAARGYESVGGPSAGLGLGWRVTDRCTWLFQVSDVHKVTNGQGSMALEMRSGLGYQFSDQCVGFAQVLFRSGLGTEVTVGLEYRPVPDLVLRTGFGEHLFMASAGYVKSHLGLQVFSSWHMALGLSNGLALTYTGRAKE